MGESQAKLYNDCNPRDDSYCIFEKDYKDLRVKYIHLLREILSIEPTSPTDVIRFQDFKRIELEELTKGANGQ